MAGQGQRANWRFPDPPALAVITQRRILSGEIPIMMVCHPEQEDWQFLTGDEADMSESEARVVGSGEVLRLDPSLEPLADLPLGCVALRRPDGGWEIAN